MSDITYTSFTARNAHDREIPVHILEFQPAASNIIPLLYNPRPSVASTVPQTVEAAREEGYDVRGAINGEFFGMNASNEGTLTGISVTNGKITSDFSDRTVPCFQEPDSSNYEHVLAIDKDCRFTVGLSRTRYHLYVDGKEIGDAAIGSVNKRYFGSNWWDPVCYFDRDCGARAYTNDEVPGAEVICQKQNNTELTPEGTLEAEVLLVNPNTYATKLASDDWFVLYNQAGHMWYDTLCALQPGQKIQIYAEETVASSKEMMKKAVTVTSATYPVVVDGENYLSRLLYKDPGLSGKACACRTAIGQKADGTVVFMCSGALTLDDLANELLSRGCVTGVNLDGGGSTAMWAEGELKCHFEGAAGRPVGSSVLAVARNEKIRSETQKAKLQTLVENIRISGYTGDKAKRIEKPLSDAGAILLDTNATNADYLRSFMELRRADAALSH